MPKDREYHVNNRQARQTAREFGSRPEDQKEGDYGVYDTRTGTSYPNGETDGQTPARRHGERDVYSGGRWYTQEELADFERRSHDESSDAFKEADAYNNL